MNAITLEALGLTNEEITNRIVDRYVEQLRTEHVFDEDGERTPIASTIDKEIRARLVAAIDAKVAEISEAHVLPKVAGLFESLVLQSTNKWGEKTGAPVTFVEYVTQRAEAYMTERVDYSGKSKAEDGNSYGWKGTQTRVSHLVEKHLHYTIAEGVKNALSGLNATLSGGIAETVKLKLAEALGALKVDVKMK